MTKLKDLKKMAQDYEIAYFKANGKAIPHHDVEFNLFLNKDVPSNRRIMMYKAWAKGWHTSNANSVVIGL